MKKKHFIYVIAIAAISLITYFVWPRSETDGHEHESARPEKTDTVAEIETPASKEVQLNEAQYHASEIELGTFSSKNLSAVISANGYTKLPPQNEAEVSVYMPGIVRSINIIEGQAVRKGQVLATIESPEFASIQQEYKTSKSSLEFLKLEFDRQKTLSDEGVNSKKTFQKTKSEYEIEKARFNSLQRQMHLLNINGNSNATTTAPVLAPISGFITEINIKIGSNAEAGKPLLGIVDNSKLHVDLLVYEKDLHKVKPGQNVRFVLTNQDNSEIMGKIFSVGKAFENETKSVAVHADISNDKQKLIPGMYVNALIDIGASAVDALPIDAVIKADGREFIFILQNMEDDPKQGKMYHFQRIEVKSGTAQLGYVQVATLQPLEKDAEIVLKGAYYIQSHLLKSEGGGEHEH
ncbi:efflux RND transporter periplasmic adaptor subunit [Flavobacterium pallidum]|uniref:Efflux RND transporter periplasmic adaptor subunit n=1 Tax=Flavobacterium pallidum TaxID=2172098 RepID=A0A2S1SED9_9FLAO|nr:efflux RND transporter periplasmic adaptor subunit [Flavobacterium pallidum]AWI24786.1 efflux RND transporter periplasmic adaptor subunit [Flavobacterium pallidum]